MEPASRSERLALDHEALRQALDDTGFVYLPQRNDADLVEVLEALGRPIYVEEVMPTPGSRSLVRSRDGISWHTDHPRADRIVWYARRQAESGGETLVVDGLAAYRNLSQEHQEALRRVTLVEHSVFAEDEDRHPMVTGDAGRIRLYYSLWLADDTMPPAEAAAFRAFGAAVDKLEHHRFLLRAGDILAVDNGRMLHARTPIGGAPARHLRRYWLAAD